MALGFTLTTACRLTAVQTRKQEISLDYSSAPTANFKATEADIPQVLELIKELAVFERSEDRVSATEESLRRHLFGPTPRAHALLASLNGETVACVVYFFSFSTFMGRPNFYLEDIFVRQEFRGSGIGHELFRYLAQIAVRHDCGRMEWAVLNWNRQAFKFYENLGATPVRDWTDFHLAKEKFEELTKGDSQPKY